jgi:hypothetical protein
MNIAHVIYSTLSVIEIASFMVYLTGAHILLSCCVILICLSLQCSLILTAIGCNSLETEPPFYVNKMEFFP